MAALTDWMLAVRAEAELARRHSHALRTDVRRQARETARRRAACDASAAHFLRLRPRTYRSAWSDLPWRLRKGIDDVLELVER